MAQRYRVYFRVPAHYHTKNVEIVGDFNDWENGSFPLEDSDGDNVWWGETRLLSGKYLYQVLIDSTQRQTDPNNPLKEIKDNEEYSVLLVGKARLLEDVLFEDKNLDFFGEKCFFLKTAFNFEKFRLIRLILVVNDILQPVNNYELYRDDLYAYVIFYYVAKISDPKSILFYFELENHKGETRYFGKNGLCMSEWEVEQYEREWIHPDELFLTPEWVRDAVFYQIFPERFANGNPRRNPEKLSAPEEPLTPESYYGGDLEGIIEHLDHLETLGVNSLYFNPLFEADSTHKYNAKDYKKIDPHFGDDQVFDQMVRLLKQKDMRFILDGVFNHCGTAFFAFQDLKEKQEQSAYKDWFFVKKFPVEENGTENYECWWNFPLLPKFNIRNPDVEAYLLDVARYWIKKGSSGWRLDVPGEIDHPFWKKFRRIVKQTKENAYIVGEIWQDGRPWLQGDEFDAVMNYRFRDAMVEFFALRKIPAEEFVFQLGRVLYEYPMQVNFAQYNLLSSHDTARFFTIAQSELNRIRLAVAFQMCYIGAPSVYYGEEIGMEGGKDPDNRRVMPWDTNRWNNELFDFYKQMIRLRRTHAVLTRGQIRFFLHRNHVVGFERFDNDENLYLLFNNSDENINVDITRYAGNGDFMDISKDYPLKRKRAYTLYANDFAVIKKTQER